MMNLRDLSALQDNPSEGNEDPTFINCPRFAVIESSTSADLPEDLNTLWDVSIAQVAGEQLRIDFGELARLEESLDDSSVM